MNATVRATMLSEYAADYARVALTNIRRPYPYYVAYVATGPGAIPPHQEQHPAFYGSYDWHSCVEMHWVLVRLLRLAPNAFPQTEVRAALSDHLSPAKTAAERNFFLNPANAHFERPYGWGWFLALAHEVARFDDPEARQWEAALRPLADLLTERFIAWLPKATYPVRYGVHSNSAFSLSLALPFAEARADAGDTRLRDAIHTAARRWFSDDAEAPAAWEPSGADFLSPSLVEAELMARVLAPAEFRPWFDRFLPGIADSQPATLFTPAHVSDPTDGHIGHLHGLNLSRAWCWRRLAESLPADDPRIPRMLEASGTHAEAALPYVVSSDYMLEHWLAAYAVLLLSPTE